MVVAPFDAALINAERILLDTSTLIAFHTRKELAHDLAKALFKRIEREDDPLRGYYSVVSATELLVRPIRTGPAETAYMHTFLRHFPNLHVLPIDLDVATQAATLRAIKNLKTPDALIIASGLLAGCEVIVSNDIEWKRKLKPLFREFRWVYLGDFLVPLVSSIQTTLRTRDGAHISSRSSFTRQAGVACVARRLPPDGPPRRPEESTRRPRLGSQRSTGGPP